MAPLAGARGRVQAQLAGTVDRATAHAERCDKLEQHLPTTNPIESVGSGLRLRADAAKRIRARENALHSRGREEALWIRRQGPCAGRRDRSAARGVATMALRDRAAECTWSVKSRELRAIRVRGTERFSNVPSRPVGLSASGEEPTSRSSASSQRLFDFFMRWTARIAETPRAG